VRRCQLKREHLKRVARLLPAERFKPRPESGLDCLVCAGFAQQRGDSGDTAGRQRGDIGETAGRQRGDSGETAGRQRGDSGETSGRQRGDSGEASGRQRGDSGDIAKRQRGDSGKGRDHFPELTRSPSTRRSPLVPDVLEDTRFAKEPSIPPPELSIPPFSPGCAITSSSSSTAGLRWVCPELMNVLRGVLMGASNTQA
jgi:hypothetical protein